MKNNRYKNALDKVRCSEEFKAKMTDKLSAYTENEFVFEEKVTVVERAKPHTMRFTAISTAACLAIGAVGFKIYRNVKDADNIDVDMKSPQAATSEITTADITSAAATTVTEASGNNAPTVMNKFTDLFENMNYSSDEKASALAKINESLPELSKLISSEGTQLVYAEGGGQSDISSTLVLGEDRPNDICDTLKSISWRELSAIEERFLLDELGWQSGSFISIFYPNYAFRSNTESNSQNSSFQFNRFGILLGDKYYLPVDIENYELYKENVWNRLERMRCLDLKNILDIGFHNVWNTADIELYEVVPMQCADDGSTQDVVYKLSGKAYIVSRALAWSNVFTASGTRSVGDETVDVSIKCDDGDGYGNLKYIERNKGTLESIDKYRSLTLDGETGEYVLDITQNVPLDGEKEHLPANYFDAYSLLRWENLGSRINDVLDDSSGTNGEIQVSFKDAEDGSRMYEYGIMSIKKMGNTTSDIQLRISMNERGIITKFERYENGKKTLSYELRNLVEFDSDTMVDFDSLK